MTEMVGASFCGATNSRKVLVAVNAPLLSCAITRIGIGLATRLPVLKFGAGVMVKEPVVPLRLVESETFAASAGLANCAVILVTAPSRSRTVKVIVFGVSSGVSTEAGIPVMVGADEKVRVQPPAICEGIT